MKGDALDPGWLIAEAYKIDGINASQCRSIFLDWALGVPMEADTAQMIATLLDRYRPDAPDHPMTDVLEQGLQKMTTAPRRRGGWRSRPRD